MNKDNMVGKSNGLVGKRLLVIDMTEDRKMVTQLFFNGNLVKWVHSFSNLGNPSMFKDVINFGEPALKFFGFKLKFFLDKSGKS